MRWINAQMNRIKPINLNNMDAVLNVVVIAFAFGVSVTLIFMWICINNDKNK